MTKKNRIYLIPILYLYLCVFNSQLSCIRESWKAFLIDLLQLFLHFISKIQLNWTTTAELNNMVKDSCSVDLDNADVNMRR